MLKETTFEPLIEFTNYYSFCLSEYETSRCLHSQGYFVKIKKCFCKTFPFAPYVLFKSKLVTKSGFEDC